MNSGPMRMVMIRSGGYDYAEVDLSTAVHVVSENNVGKTSLISALQFLYIDDSNNMRFSHDWKLSKKHYFPHVGSVLLFECMTPTGFQVLAFHGLGDARNNDFERLIYGGSYERDDYFDGRTSRSWPEVIRRLTTRDVRVQLEAKHIRAALTSSGDSKGPPLGLLPLTRPVNYENFRFLFKNLLRLAHITQDQLKALFVDIAGPRLRQREVDLKADYAELYYRVTRETAALASLRKVEPVVVRLMARTEARDTAVNALRDLWRTLEHRANQDRDAMTRDTLEHQRTRHEVSERITKLEVDLKLQDDIAGGLQREVGETEATLRQLRTLEKSVSDYHPEHETNLRAALTQERDALAGRLRNVTRANIDSVEREISQVKRSIAESERLIENQQSILATSLKLTGAFTANELSDAFRILNPGLLASTVGAQKDITITDAEVLHDVIRGVARGFDAEAFTGGGVVIERNALASEDPMRRFTDLTVVREQLRQAETRRKELDEVLSDNLTRVKLEKQQSNVEKELEAANKRHAAWLDWLESKVKIPELQRHLTELQQQIVAVDSERATLREAKTDARLHLNKLEHDHLARLQTFKALSAAIQKLPKLPTDDVTTKPDEPSTAPLEELIRSYQRRWNEYVDLDRQTMMAYQEVHQITGERYLEKDDAATLKRLKEEVEALGEKTKAIEELWVGIVEGMRNAFKGLLDGVYELKRQVATLNKALENRRVSNLERIELQLITSAGIERRLKAIVDAEESPLFGDQAEHAKAQRDVAAWIDVQQRLSLLDLFDLKFVIVDRTGTTKTFTSLDQIESKGTSTTIKVLVHLELMKALLTDTPVSIPFYLDEVDSLDAKNLKSLVDHAQSMGFAPIVASPKPSDAVDVLYYLRQSRHGLILNHTSRIIIKRRNDNAA